MFARVHLYPESPVEIQTLTFTGEKLSAENIISPVHLAYDPRSRSFTPPNLSRGGFGGEVITLLRTLPIERLVLPYSLAYISDERQEAVGRISVKELEVIGWGDVVRYLNFRFPDPVVLEKIRFIPPFAVNQTLDDEASLEFLSEYDVFFEEMQTTHPTVKEIEWTRPERTEDLSEVAVSLGKFFPGLQRLGVVERPEKIQAWRDEFPGIEVYPVFPTPPPRIQIDFEVLYPTIKNL